VVPTRELAIQVSYDLAAAGKASGARVITVYGGRAYEPQVDALRAGVDVVVGTPGRLLDLVRQGYLRLSDVGTLVLDEADKMLDLGFLPDVERILELTPPDRQTMLFSATMPGEVVTLARRYCASRCTYAPSSTTRPCSCRSPSSTSSAPTRWTRSRCWSGCSRRTGAG
jgi:superfamily II DNA/RNA helicase